MYSQFMMHGQRNIKRWFVVVMRSVCIAYTIRTIAHRSK